MLLPPFGRKLKKSLYVAPSVLQNGCCGLSKVVTGSLYAELTNATYGLLFVQGDQFVFFILTQCYRTFN